MFPITRYIFPSAYSLAFGSNDPVSILKLGPMVLETKAPKMYFPLSFSGFFSAKASIKAFKFLSSSVSLKLLLPSGAWMLLPLSTLYLQVNSFRWEGKRPEINEPHFSVFYGFL